MRKFFYQKILKLFIKYLLIYLESLSHWAQFKDTPVKEVSWSILKDLLHSNILLNYRPQEIAIAIIYFVCICYGVKIPYNDSAEKTWWKVIIVWFYLSHSFFFLNLINEIKLRLWMKSRQKLQFMT